MIYNLKHNTMLNSPQQTIKARVELYSGSTLVKECNCSDILSSFTVERTGQNKFFGYGICQKLTVTLIDLNREIVALKDMTIKVSFGVDTDYIYPLPTFTIEEVTRNEATNEITIVAYDALYRAANHSLNEYDYTGKMSYPITFANYIAQWIGLINASWGQSSTLGREYYSTGANVDGTESLRRMLDVVAEATGTIYYVGADNYLKFKDALYQTTPVLTIDRNKYFELTNDGEVTLGAIVHTTELGDTVTPSGAIAGATQYIRNNPFWENSANIGATVDKAQAALGGITFSQFVCNWCGNYLVEVGDKIALTTENGSNITAMLLDDTLTFDGTLSQLSQWRYDANDAESAENPSNLGEALNQTFARVDKVNKRIDLVVSDADGRMSAIEQTLNGITLKVEEHDKEIDAFNELETGQVTSKLAEIELELDGITATVNETVTKVDGYNTRIETAETQIAQNKDNIALSATKTEVEEVDGKVTTNKEAIGALEINTNSINLSVSSLETTTKEALDGISGDVEKISKQASLAMTEDMVKIAIDSSLENGVDKVTTSTGYSFTDSGLIIEKSDSEIGTKITEDGMTVSKQGEAVLVANNQGVEAVNLSASTYLIIGGNSRFENYYKNGKARTACFWIGG